MTLGKTIKIRKGLDVPITGRPRQVLGDAKSVQRVALLGDDDYIGMKPTMEVAEGDRVRRGQLLFTDKKTEGVRYTSPGCGRVSAVNRGAKRRLLSVVIDLDGDESVGFESFTASDLHGASAAKLREQLVEAGLWTAFRTRPYSKVPAPASSPASIFVNAMDTHPLAPDPAIVLADRGEDWQAGLQVLARLDAGPVRVCRAADGRVRVPEIAGVEIHDFAGPHPAGLPGTHIHFLDPVHQEKRVWTIGYQDVVAFGEHVRTGRYPVDRVVALAGPGVKNPRLIRTVQGASLDDLTRDELNDGTMRLVSGSLLGGRTAEGPQAYLGRYHHQVSVLEDGGPRELLGWQMPGFGKYSTLPIYASAAIPGKRFAFNTLTQGSRRAMVPVGTYERVMPLDILPTFLLRALIVRDTDQAQALGCLELDEEDLALCSFVCPGKYEYGPILRDNLTRIEREG